MKKVLKIILLCCFVLILFFAVYFWIFNQKALKIQTPAGDVISYQVEQALTPEEQHLGLMNRPSLSPKTGMIFLFQPPRVARMWMKNTLIPLDMIFFNKNTGANYAIQIQETFQVRQRNR